MGRPTQPATTFISVLQAMGALLAAAILGFALSLPAAAQGTPPRDSSPLDSTALDSTALDATALDTTALDTTALDTVAFDATAQAATAEGTLTAWTDPNTGDLQWRFPGIVIPIPIFCKGPAEPLPQPPPPPANPGPAGTANYQVCPQAAGRVPPAVQQYALVNPHAIQGYGEYRNPNVPPSPWNQLRTWLHLRDPGKPFSICNSVVWKAGCY